MPINEKEDNVVTISYTPIDGQSWDVCLYGQKYYRKLGRAFKGRESAYFKFTNGKGKLFDDFAELYRRLMKVATATQARMRGR